MRKLVSDAEDNIKKSGGKVSSGKVIVELSFGFWLSLFYPQHFKLIGGSAIKSFPGKPSGVNRKSIHKKLDGIRIFRNRIYHNEPICFKSKSAEIDFSYPKSVLSEIYELISWMDSDLLDYVKEFDGIGVNIASGEIFAGEI